TRRPTCSRTGRSSRASSSKATTRSPSPSTSRRCRTSTRSPDKPRSCPSTSGRRSRTRPRTWSRTPSARPRSRRAAAQRRTTPPSNKAVRQAIAYSIDRPSVSQKGEFGYEPPGNQTGVLSPTFDSWIDKAQADTYGYKFDVAKAQGLLQQAGFTKGSSGIFQDSSGKKLSLSIINIAGYTDWVASVQVIQDNLKQVGIELKPVNLEATAYFDKLFTGNFELAYGSVNTSPGPSPYYELRNTLHSATTAA